MKRLRTQGGTDIMRNWSWSSKLWWFMLSLSSQLKIFWILQISKKKAVPPPYRVGQDEKLVRREQNLKLSPWLGVFDSAVWGDRHITQWQTKTSVSFQLVAPRSICLSVLLCLSISLYSCAHCRINTHTWTHTRIYSDTPTHTHTLCAADENRRSALWIIELSW